METVCRDSGADSRSDRNAEKFQSGILGRHGRFLWSVHLYPPPTGKRLPKLKTRKSVKHFFSFCEETLIFDSIDGRAHGTPGHLRSYFPRLRYHTWTRKESIWWSDHSRLSKVSFFIHLGLLELRQTKIRFWVGPAESNKGLRQSTPDTLRDNTLWYCDQFTNNLTECHNNLAVRMSSFIPEFRKTKVLFI